MPGTNTSLPDQIFISDYSAANLFSIIIKTIIAFTLHILKYAASCFTIAGY
ncbi:hypothetical protein SAMN05444277_101143 [Parafilimonas terrae]|jgi:hypothetical protein|uniref:Uncharacterized protein n=1 Tax=Parafilimonas terrae TaxID=1465490 RepID=A0A1I5R9C2_9BACT|nr:hypothetical protein SAMN05444277_101143 [Parafilimonas terrae]